MIPQPLDFMVQFSMICILAFVATLAIGGIAFVLYAFFEMFRNRPEE